MRLIFFLTCISLFGCAPHIKPYSSHYVGTERVLDKNYILNIPKFSYVGESMVKVRDYNILKSTLPEVIASSDSVISGGLLELPIKKDQIYKIIGEVKIGNRFYPLVQVRELPNSLSYYGVALKPDGQIQGKAVLIVPPEIGGNITVIYTFKATNNLEFKFIETKTTEVSVEQGNSNYELIYSGTNGTSFFISYREYTNTNLARDAFFQNLTYSINSEKIRFKNIEINIDGVSNEMINFTVVSDGQKN